MSDPKSLLTSIGSNPAQPAAPPPAAPNAPPAQPGQIPTLGGVGNAPGTAMPPSAGPAAPLAPPSSAGAPPPSVGASPFPQPAAPPTSAPPAVFTPDGFRPPAPAGHATVYHEPSEGIGMGKILGGVAGLLAVALAIAAIMLLKPPAPVAAPTGFTNFAAKDGSFTIDTPNGWNNEPTGSAAGDGASVKQDGITMTNGSAQVEVTISSVAGLMEQQLMFGKEVVPESMGGSRANGIDKTHKPAVSKRYKNYKEKPVEGMNFEMGNVLPDELKRAFVADVKVYEWTADGTKWGFGGKMHGYRAVVAGVDNIAAICCQASEKDFAKLKPAFTRIMSSIREPNAKGPGSLSVPGAGNIQAPGVGGGSE